MSQIEKAYKILSRSNTRREYDRDIYPQVCERRCEQAQRDLEAISSHLQPEAAPASHPQPGEPGRRKRQREEEPSPSMAAVVLSQIHPMRPVASARAAAAAPQPAQSARLPLVVAAAAAPAPTQATPLTGTLSKG